MPLFIYGLLIPFYSLFFLILAGLLSILDLYFLNAIIILLSPVGLILVWGRYCHDLIYKSQRPKRDFFAMHSLPLAFFIIFPGIGSYYFFGILSNFIEGILEYPYNPNLLALLCILITGYIFSFKEQKIFS
jgi:hypothetical protein